MSLVARCVNVVPCMRFQERDGEILKAIHGYGGVLAKRHIKEMFFSTTSVQAMDRRILILKQHGYLMTPSKEHRRTKPICEPVVWVGWRGAQYLAGLSGIDVPSPKNENENQLREFFRRLRGQGFGGAPREPRWIQLEHDLAVIDFRLAVEASISQLTSLTLVQWIHEGEFLSDPDLVHYRVPDAEGHLKAVKKLIRPDSFFVIVDSLNRVKDSAVRRRLLLEWDGASISNPRWGKEKALPGVAYIRSEAYKKRFGGYSSGRWLVVTTGKVRRDNLMQQTRRVLGSDARIFLFTTAQEVSADTVLTSPIWKVPGKMEPVSLFSAG